jgi:hypothetical protein
MVSIDLVHVYKTATNILDILEGLTIFHEGTWLKSQIMCHDKIKTATKIILDLFYGP